jgi:hypothetical protein
MIRRLFTVASVLSLVTCIGVVGLWFRSRTAGDWIGHYGPTYIRGFSSGSGRMIFSRVENPWPRMAAEMRQLMAEYPPFAERNRNNPEFLRYLRLAKPHWERETFPAYDHASSPIPASSHSYLGFGYWRWISEGDTGQLGLWIAVPYWGPALLTAILPAIWFACLGRDLRRNRLGLCRACGYDLRASKDRCPECGTPISPEAKA